MPNLHDLAKKADRGRHVGSKWGSEDDLCNACGGKVFTFLADSVWGTADGECFNFFLSYKSTDCTEVKAGQCVLDLCYVCKVETVAEKK